MMPRSVVFLGVLSLFVLLLAVLWVYNHLRARRLQQGDWEQLLGRLIAIDPYKIKRVAWSVAVDTDARADSDHELDPQEVWDLLGGLDGLEAMEKNCGVIIDIACHVQMTYPEALVVAEQLRLNAREINWHVSRLLASSRVENLHASFPHYAQRAAATYYKMTQSLLAVSRAAGFAGHAELQAAL